MPIKFEDKLVIKLGKEYFKIDDIHDAHEVALKIVKEHRIKVCEITGVFNIINYCKLQTIQIQEVTELQTLDRGKAIKAITDIVVDVVKSGSNSISLNEIMEQYEKVNWKETVK